MDKAQIAKLLTFCAAYDSRTIGEADVEAWHKSLAHIPFADAQLVVLEYHKHNTDRMLAAHVTKGVSILRRDRTERADASFDASPYGEDEAGYRAALRRHRRAIGDGIAPPVQAGLTRAAPRKAIENTFKSVPS